LVAGTSEVGTLYELHRTGERRVLRKKRYGFELLVKRPGSDELDRGPSISGPVDRQRSLEILISVHGDEPAEVFMLGELPTPASSLLVEFPDGRRVSSQVSAEQPEGVRAFVLSSSGRARPSSFEVFDDSGAVLLKEPLTWQMPCPDDGGVLFATQRHELPARD
jgi:hypothetical protein